MSRLRFDRVMRVLSALCFAVVGAQFGVTAVAQTKPPAASSQSESKKKDSAEPDRKQADNEKPDTEKPLSVEQLTAKVRMSIVVVSFTGRDGKQLGLGTGFVISPDGLIATNLHVIGEARPISVKFADGKKFPVTTIHATERLMDLALLKIDAKNLPALEIGDSDKLKQGQDVVAIGNPFGLQHSVVAGVVSGRREIEGKPMIQLAIPIERGNSGGPLLDRNGRVHGILTLKSLVSDNLGFAVAVNALKPLIAKPNPIPMSRWLTIGALDPKQWTSKFGARWRQRAGRILVTGRGSGIGRRSLCLSQKPPGDLPFELAVQVKFEDTAGAAGLVFHSDGNEKHYGFYPSNGSLRLSRFDGADVYSWQVLKQVRSPHYRPGEWNTLKVRLEKDTVQCFLNDELVIQWKDLRFKSGKVGLAQFRETEAEFKGFQFAAKIESTRPSPESVKRVTALVKNISTKRPPTDDLVNRLLPDAKSGPTVLRERAKLLEKQAERLRQLALAVQQRGVQKQLVAVLGQPEEKIDVLHAALLIGNLDNDELDVAAYRGEVDRMVADVQEKLPKDADEKKKLDVLNEYFFNEMGYHGSRTNYYNRSNSYLNEVIDDREGLPITLSVLYIEMARRIGLKIVGVGLPGHFVVRLESKKTGNQLIDVFDKGTKLTRKDAEARVKSITGRPLRDEHLLAASKKAIIVRMLHNLMGNARNSGDAEAMLRYVDTIVAIDDTAGEERWFRAVLRFQSGRIAESIADIDWLLKKKPDNVDLGRVRELRRILDSVEQ